MNFLNKFMSQLRDTDRTKRTIKLDDSQIIKMRIKHGKINKYEN